MQGYAGDHDSVLNWASLVFLIKVGECFCIFEFKWESSDQNTNLFKLSLIILLYL